ncbi:MAG: protein kinase [Muribaculaceae bacterium]|nr:protein kinase [Muribaculaceae bacterium]
MADEDKTIGGRRNKREDLGDVHSTGRASGRGGNQEVDVHSTGRASGRGGNQEADVHSTGRASGRGGNQEADVHSTGRASGRGSNQEADVHSTGRASGRGTGAVNNDSGDGHSTGKANSRGNDENIDLKPFEQKNSVNITGNTSSVAATGKMKWPGVFILEGIKYKNEGILSDSSGEAIVFTVSRDGKKFALKLYYYDPEHRPNHKILEKIRQLGGSGLLVPIVSHGEWNNPDLPGEKNDYELMEFCEGGSLDGVILEGNEKGLTEVAVKMGAAIDFLAKHGILHRDIKPANFFYKDKAKTQIVLADFGISVECPEGGFVKIDEMRSPVYAAPEFYTNVPGEPAEVGVESDYFSLGVALLCLWMGKAKLTANESKLLRAKLNETLPMPSDMSHHMVSLLKALTRLKMADRANFEDIKRWVKGEDLDNEGQGEVNSGFQVVFNSAKNQVAHSPAELAHYLLEDKVLGKKYLYSGRVTKWLEETGRNEIAVNVEEVVEKIYPRNQDAGLMTIVYMLDPSMDYVSPEGTHMSDPAEISKYAIKHLNEMKSEVLEDDTNLKIYFKALKLDKVLDQLDDYLIDDNFDTGDYDLNAYLAAYYLAEQFNDLPLPVEVRGTFEFATTIDELFGYIQEDGGYVNDTNEAMLKSPGFILWLAYRDPALAGKIRKLIDSSDDDVESIYYHSDSPFRILYELDPNVDVDFNTDEDSEKRVYTIQEVGEYLADLLTDCQTGKDDDGMLVAFFEDMDGSYIGDYLRARGEAYFNFLNWNRYCMDVENEENIQKAGPYDTVIGAYKSVAGFLGKAPTYTLDGKVIDSPDQLKNFPKDVVAKALGGDKNEMPTGDGTPVAWLDAWLTVFFQENPKLDLSKKFTYEKETAKYIEFISKLDPKDYYAQRYNKAIKQIDSASKKLEKSDKKVKRNRIFFLLLAGIPTLMILGLSWFFAIPDVNPISGNFLATWFICFIAIAICAGILFEGFFGSLLPGAIGGLIVAAIAWAGFAWFPSVLYFIVGALVLGGAIFSVASLFRRDKVDTGGKVISGNMFEYRQLDALYFTFRDTDEKNVENALTLYSQRQRSYDKATRSGMASVGWFWAAPVWMIFLIWFFATPELSGHYSWVYGRVGEEKVVAGQWVLGTWEFKIPTGTKIVCQIDTIEDGKNIYGTIKIGNQAPVPAIGWVRSKKDTIPESFSFMVKTGSYNKQNLDAEYNSRTKEWRGLYYDRKTLANEVIFTKTPLTNTDKGQKSTSSSSTQKQAPAKKKEAPVVNIEEPTEEIIIEDAPQEVNEEKPSSSNILGEDTLK